MNTDAQVRVIVGLGNPDPDLLHTYHNAGMLALPFLARALAPDDGAALSFKRYKDIFEYAAAGGYTFVKPLTYMNESGRAVAEALKVLKAGAADIAVAYDESDLPLGSFKIVRDGGAAGHKGILSIIDHVKTPDFVRIRIGVRDPQEERRRKAGDFVLSPISASDMRTLEETFSAIAAKLKAMRS
jgi:PTH1 family peptidyl-tRNA hydrolase